MLVHKYSSHRRLFRFFIIGIFLNKVKILFYSMKDKG